MGHLVVVEVAGGGEALAADAALVRLLAAVDPAVRVERRRRREALRADVAHVRPLARVDADVPLQQRGAVEALAAVVARQHLEGQKMDGHIWSHQEYLVTNEISGHN